MNTNDLILQCIRNIEILLDIESDPRNRVTYHSLLKSLLQQLESMKSA